MAHDDAAVAGDTPDPVPQDTPFDEVSSHVVFRLRLAHEAVFRAFAQETNDPDLKPRVFSALSVIAQYPGISQSDLGAHIGRDKSTVTPLIAELIASGHVAREQGSSDRRSFHLTLTSLGHDLLHRQRQSARRHEARIAAAIGTSEAKAEFMRSLDRLIAVFG